MDGKIGRTNIVPDIRPENIDTYTETHTPEGGTEQSAEYKIVDAHPIIGGVLDKLAFFRTHASAVWYNKMKNITVLQKLDNLASNIGVLTQLATTDKTSLVAAVNELNENMANKQSTITGGASTIAASNLSANRVLTSNSAGKVATSSITTTQLGYMTGLKENIQNQIDNISYIKTIAGNKLTFNWIAEGGITYLAIFLDNTRIALIRSGSVLG